MRLIHRCQEGFTTVTLMGVLFVGGLLVAASFAAVDPDIRLTGEDEHSKQAYAAAEAGLNYYANRLGGDNAYYTKCTNVPPPNGPGTNPVNQEWRSGVADPRAYNKIPGFEAKYAIELLPNAPGYTSCVEGVQASMVNPQTGSLRIRSTGMSANRKRSIVATFRRQTFIDFIWFTDLETADPLVYPEDEQAWATNNCQRYRHLRHSSCDVISFLSADSLRGPFHSNDSIAICGSPTFGDTANDLIELNGASPGYLESCGSMSPRWNGTRDYPAGILPMPSSNADLASAAEYTFAGETRIVMNTTTMTVETYKNPLQPSLGKQTQTLPIREGVIYVTSPSCTVGYAREQRYDPAAGCGNVRISGTYGTNVTIGADNDIIVEEDFRRSNDSLLAGLVANGFVRVYHPVTFGFGRGGCTNNSTLGPESIQIDASILSVRHSFIADNWYCGDPLGTLTVNGSIAQKFRGYVSTFSGNTVVTGYAKAYSYNTNLKFREPPYFVNPAESAWQIIRQNEQLPAR